MVCSSSSACPVHFPIYNVYSNLYTSHDCGASARVPRNGSTSYDGKYLLKTEVTKEETGIYASFSICDPVSGEELYQCPKYYRTMDLKKWIGPMIRLTISSFFLVTQEQTDTCSIIILGKMTDDNKDNY